MTRGMSLQLTRARKVKYAGYWRSTSTTPAGVNASRHLPDPSARTAQCRRRLGPACALVVDCHDNGTSTSMTCALRSGAYRAVVGANDHLPPTHGVYEAIAEICAAVHDARAARYTSARSQLQRPGGLAAGQKFGGDVGH